MSRSLPPSSAAVRALLGGAIDYAGLFPPAALGMEQAVANYARYRAGADSWALGRFVVPFARLAELERALEPLHRTDAMPWRLSVTLGADLAGDVGAIAAHHARARASDVPRRTVVDAVEFVARTVDDLALAATHLPAGLTAYAEVHRESGVLPLLHYCAHHGLRAKVRTGGVAADTFPSVDALLEFLSWCVALELPFKATAGLHHPLRGSYPLTYEPDAAHATMYGFLNLLLATAALRTGASTQEARTLLLESDPRAIAIDDEGLSWQGRLHFRRSALAAARFDAMVGFGSCSFLEPLSELRSTRILREQSTTDAAACERSSEPHAAVSAGSAD